MQKICSFEFLATYFAHFTEIFKQMRGTAQRYLASYFLYTFAEDHSKSFQIPPPPLHTPGTYIYSTIYTGHVYTSTTVRGIPIC